MSQVPELIQTFLSAWTAKDASIARAVVSNDVVIIDPSHNVVGPDALEAHLLEVFPRFEFSVEYEDCFVEGSRVAFLCTITMTGIGPFAGLVTSFRPAVFVDIVDGKITSWREFWDPTPMRKAISNHLRPAS